MIYLDHASHTPADPEVLAEFCRVEGQFMANPMAAHSAGQAAWAELERLTSSAAGLLSAKPSELIWTSGASEANNLAIKGIARAYRHTGRHIISTCLEHPSVSGPLAALKDQGYEIELADIRENATVDLKHIAALLRRDTILLCVVWADSELGAIQPISEITELLKKYPNCNLHVDAAQAAGKIPVSFDGIDTLCLSPHKFHGLCGSGILLKREAVILEPQIHGGMGASMLRGGTPALALAASSFRALEMAVINQADRYKKVESLNRHVSQALRNYPNVRINSPNDGSPYILNLSVQGIKGSDFQAALDKRGVCVSVKSACSAPGTPSRPVFAVSRDKKNAMSSWRIGFSHLTELAEVESFLGIFNECYNHFKTQ